MFASSGSFSCQTLQVSSGHLSFHWNLISILPILAPLAREGWIFPMPVDLASLPPNGSREPEVFACSGSFSCQTLQVSSGHLSFHWNLISILPILAPLAREGWIFPMPVDLASLPPNGSREPEVFACLGSFSCQTLQVSSGHFSHQWNSSSIVTPTKPPKQNFQNDGNEEVIVADSKLATEENILEETKNDTIATKNAKSRPGTIIISLPANPQPPRRSISTLTKKLIASSCLQISP